MGFIFLTKKINFKLAKKKQQQKVKKKIELNKIYY